MVVQRSHQKKPLAFAGSPPCPLEVGHLASRKKSHIVKIYGNTDAITIGLSTVQHTIQEGLLQLG